MHDTVFDRVCAYNSNTDSAAVTDDSEKARQRIGAPSLRFFCDHKMTFFVGMLIGACIGFIACALLVIGYTEDD